MTRFILVLVVGLLMYGASSPLLAEPNHPPVVGLLVGAARSDDRATEAFREGLRQFGYVDGRTVKVEFRTAEGRYETLPALAADLVKLQPDVIVVTNDGQRKS